MPGGDPSRGASFRRAAVALAAVGCLLLAGFGVVAYWAMGRLQGSATAGVTVRPTATILMSVRDLTRLETNELHLEKVIDLTDRQSRFWGLIETSDAVLLVAAGDVIIGIDLTRLEEQDFQLNRETGIARLVLPSPEILSIRLDEEHTYVYRRTTDMLARRNEQLESRARQEALRAIGEAARDAEVMEKARKQAERQIQQLLEKFGVARTTIGWRPI